MLATLTEKPFDHKDWIYEIKWDGYRILAYINKGNTELYSRNLKSFARKFKPIKDSLNKISSDIIFDGEIIITDKSGRSDFSGLRQYLTTGKGSPVYYVFDILYFNGYSLLDVPLLDRKKLLKAVLPPLPNIKISEHLEKTGTAFFNEAARNGLEGIMAKQSSSLYEPSTRSKNWLKIKVRYTQDTVIGGYIRGTSGNIKSLLTGVYEDNNLVYTGNIGSGLKRERSGYLLNILNKITAPRSPFKAEIKSTDKIIWVKPLIVAEAEFTQWTPDGKMRHPVFKGLREDKVPVDVVKENFFLRENIEDNKSHGSHFKGTLSNPEKIFWPEDGYTKKDLFDYYREISDFILPHIIDRPQSLHRHPDGIKKESFFQKDINFKPPSWIETFPVADREKKKEIHYLVCKDLNSLLYMVNLGCIEINPWLSRIDDIKHPDFIVIDLDPTDTGFNKVVKTALKVKEVLDMVSIDGFIKTSGATGLHIYIPTGTRYDYSQALQFANMLAIVIKRKIPGLSSIERSPRKRKDKVYIDYLQNRSGQTIAAPYCVRPRPGAPVSTPLFWEELDDIKDPAVFNVKSIFKRLEKHGDIWKDIYKNVLDMEKVLTNIQELYGDFVN